MEGRESRVRGGMVRDGMVPVVLMAKKRIWMAKMQFHMLRSMGQVM